MVAEGGEEERDGSEGHDGVAEEDAGHGERITFDLEIICGEGEASEASGEERQAMEQGKPRSASGEEHSEDDAEGDGIELNEGVGPDFGFPGVARGEIPAGEIGHGEHNGGGYEQAAFGKFAHGGGPEDVELLFDGDAPEREDYRRWKADEDQPPVATEQGKGESGAPSDVLAGNVPLHHPGEGEKGEIKRPDAQDAADVEGLEIDAAKAGTLADEKLGDEIGAEQEEEIDAEGSGGSEGGQGRCEHGSDAHVGVEGRVVRKSVVKEDEEKREEAEDVEFGMIEACGERADWVRGHWTFPNRAIGIW